MAVVLGLFGDRLAPPPGTIGGDGAASSPCYFFGEYGFGISQTIQIPTVKRSETMRFLIEAGKGGAGSGEFLDISWP